VRGRGAPSGEGGAAAAQRTGGGAVHGAAAPTARTRVSRTTSMAYASLHSWERPFIAFPLGH
jgi:hypothetical protein